MPTVTALQSQARDPQRVNLFLDGRFALGLSAEVVVQRGIRVGDTYDEHELRSIARQEDEQQAHAAALHFLSYRPRAQQEVVRYLQKRNLDAESIETVVERLVQSGLLDDRQFAQFWIDNRQTFKPRGTRALRTEMRQKGLESEVIEEVLDELPDEEGIAYAASAARLRSMRNLDDRAFFQRMVGFLQRRGFPYSVAANVTRRRLVERGSTEEFGDE